MTTNDAPDVSGLVDDLLHALGPHVPVADERSSAIQDALRVLLQRIKLVTDAEPDPARTRRPGDLSAEIASVERPLTAMLKIRLSAAAGVAPGEAEFMAIADTRTIISLAQLACPPPSFYR